jgi:ABC-2 type transport system ATP-binding protein
MSTHTLEVAQEMCDRITIILKGRIIARGTVDQLRQMGRTNDEAAGLKPCATPAGETEQLTSVFLKLTGGSALQEIDETL